MLCGWISLPVFLCVVLWIGKPVRSASIESRKTSDVLAAFKRAVLEKKAHGIRLSDRESELDTNVRSHLRASREQPGLLEALREAVVEKKYLENESDLESLCIAGKAKLVCSGRGTCIQGRCECGPVYPFKDMMKKHHGQFCECNDYICDYSSGGMCGGLERGICRCGKCECRPGWSGARCDYPSINMKKKKNTVLGGRDYFNAIGIGKSKRTNNKEDKELLVKDRDYFDAIGIGPNSYGNSYPSNQGYSWDNDEDMHGYPVAPAGLWDDNETDESYEDEYSGFK